VCPREVGRGGKGKAREAYDLNRTRQWDQWPNAPRSVAGNDGQQRVVKYTDWREEKKVV